jgi:hypothetical protein
MYLLHFSHGLHLLYAFTSRKITSAMERAAEEIISNRQVIRKVF